MKLRAYKIGDLAMVQHAIVRLRQARNLLVKAGAAKAAQKASRALESAEGAERHAARLALRPAQARSVCEEVGHG